MRKFAVTTFAVLYGILVLSVTAERFNDWAAQEAPGHGHSVSGQHFPCFDKTEKSETHLRYKRIIERAFVVESPREGVGASTGSMRHSPLPCFEYQAAWNGTPISPRAPPFQI
jgi:hypothetical protein